MAVTRSEEIREGIKQAAREITDPPLSSMFGAKVALTEMDHEELDAKEAPSTAGTAEASIFRTAWNNEREAAAGSIDGVYTRTWDAHNRKLREAAQQKKRDDVTDLLALLGDMGALAKQLGDAREALQLARDDLIEAYGENYLEVITKTYLDDETAQRLPGEGDEDYELRMAKEIQKRIDAGEIQIDDPKIRKWLDSAEETRKIKERALELDAKIEARYGLNPEQEALRKEIRGESMEVTSELSDLSKEKGYTQSAKEAFEMAHADATIKESENTKHDQVSNKDSVLNNLFG